MSHATTTPESSGVAGAGLLIPWKGSVRRVSAMTISVRSLDPLTIPKYVEPLVIPPAMPQAPRERRPTGLSAEIDYYEIAVRQFQQQILPPACLHDDGLELRLGRPARLVQLPRLHDRGDGWRGRCG